MKDNPQRKSAARPETADAMPHRDTINSVLPLDWALIHSKHDAISSTKRYDFDSRLHPRPLLRKHEFPAAEVFLRRAQQDGQLQGESNLTIEILM